MIARIFVELQVPVDVRSCSIFGNVKGSRLPRSVGRSGRTRYLLGIRSEYVVQRLGLLSVKTWGREGIRVPTSRVSNGLRFRAVLGVFPRNLPGVLKTLAMSLFGVRLLHFLEDAYHTLDFC